MSPELLSPAVVLWAGWHETSFPRHDERAIVAAYGRALGSELVVAIKALAHDFYSSEATNEVADLAEMGDRAAAEFRQRHPEIAEDAVEALRWCYTFDNR